ncbi:MAG TPA: tetratricopeptide repeat protein [Polyangia bacterium]|jgi:hypothetical protein|nr:tetratricopeptide repeat protein [Polyangia bacterium]
MPSRSVASLLAALLASVVASNVWAVSPEAEVLFREGRSLMATGNVAAACARFARSYALEASSGTLLNLASCHEREGKFAAASAEYETAARIAREQHREDRARVAEERVAALEPKLAHLILVAATPVPGLRVAVDDGPPGEVGEVGEAGSQVPVPIDPGVRKVLATASGYRPWSTTVEVRQGERRTVEIPPLVESASSVTLPADLPHGSESPVVARTALSATTSPAPPRRSHVDLYIALGGAALVAAGAVAWGVAYENFSSAKTACNEGPGCPDYDARVSSIRTFQGIAVGAWIVGGAVLLVSGVRHALGAKTKKMPVAISPWSNQFDIRATF